MRFWLRLCNFLSFIKIKNNINFKKDDETDPFKDFAIVTNSNFDFKGANFDVKDQQAQKWDELFEEKRLNHDDMLYLEGVNVKKYQLYADDDELKSFIKGNLLISALILKEIQKFPAAQCELEKGAKEIIGKAGAIGILFEKKLNELLKTQRGKSEEDQTNSEFSEKDREKLKDSVIKFKDLRKTVRNVTDMEHVIPSIERNTDLEEFIDLSKIKSVKALDKRLSTIISTQSIIEVALDDATFEEYFAEFVQKFQFVTNFPNEEKLGDFNKSKLGDTFKLLNTDLVSASFEKKMLEILNCNEGENDFYTEEGAAAFEEKIASAINGLLTSGLSMVYPEDLKAHNISFDKKSFSCTKLLRILNSFLNLEQYGEKVCSLYTQSTRLSAIKVLQILENHETYKKKDSLIFIRFTSLIRDGLKNYIFDAFKKHGSHNLLVIDFEDDKQHDEKSLDSIHGQVENILRGLLNGIHSKKKRVILISQHLNLNDIGLKYLQADDRTFFNDLDEKTQNVVLGSKVSFQGTIMSLNRLIDRHYGAKFFDEETLTRLLNGDKMKIGNENAFSSNGYVQDYYIERTFHRQKIKNDILKMGNQLLFITAAQGEHLVNSVDLILIKLGARKENIFQWKDNDRPNMAYSKGIILPPPNKSDREYYEMFRRLGRNAHWLELHRSTVLFWKMGRGEFSDINENINKNLVPATKPDSNLSLAYGDMDKYRLLQTAFMDDIEILSEKHFCNVENVIQKLVIIANEPGMGKSTVLTSVARNMKELNDDERNESEVKWIVRINLNDYANDLRSYEFEEHDIERAIDFVTKMAIAGDEANYSDVKIQRTFFK